MALIEIAIPLDDEIDHWEQLVVLDEREYRMTFEWSTREEKWYLSIADQDGDDLLTGLALNEGVELCRLSTDTSLPQGTLSLLDATGAESEPERDQLGVRWVLLYDEAE